jgi:hypothetical protein
MTRLAFCIAPVVLLAVLVCLSGCGGGGHTVSAASGVRAVGTLTAVRTLADGVADEGSAQGDPDIGDGYLVPSAMTLAVSKLELLKSEDDSTPYVVFDTGPDPANAKIIDLSSGKIATFGQNNDYPPPGTYTHVRLTLAYMDQAVPIDVGDGEGLVEHHCRVYTVDTGNVLSGDVCIDYGGQMSWIENNSFVPIKQSRPSSGPAGSAGAIKCVDWCDPAGPDDPPAPPDDSTFGPDAWTIPLAPGSEVVVPENPQGEFVINLNFDVTQSPEIPGSDGTIIFDDVDGDGNFEPGTDDAGGATGVDETPTWEVLPPLVTAGCTRQ